MRGEGEASLAYAVRVLSRVYGADIERLAALPVRGSGVQGLQGRGLGLG